MTLALARIVEAAGRNIAGSGTVLPMVAARNDPGRFGV